jgi:hypothetical protein
MGKKFPPFVEVFWDDAQSTAEWVERNAIPKTPRHVTRGWLIEDSEERLVIAATLQLTEGDSLGEVVTILQGMVVRKRVMRVKEPRC